MSERYEIRIGYLETSYVERVVVVDADTPFDVARKAQECDTVYEEEEILSQPRERREVTALTLPKRITR